MRGFQMTGVGLGAVTTMPEPNPLPGELVLQPVVSGVCSTDVHVFLEGALNPRVPLVLGHESVARVMDAREGVWNAYGQPVPATGDLVVVEPLFPCRRCQECAKGLLNLCRNSRHMGINRDGCFAEFFTAPAWRATVLPPDMDPMRAIFIEPLACALRFIDLSGLRAGQTLLILGAGPAGLLTAGLGVSSGLNVLVSEPEPSRRRLAEAAGAQAADPANLFLELNQMSGGRGADSIVEVTGNPAAVAQALELATPGTTVVVTGLSGNGHLQVDLNQIVLRELNVKGAVASRGHFARALELIQSGRARVNGLASAVLPWMEAEAAIRMVQQDRSLGKVLLTH